MSDWGLEDLTLGGVSLKSYGYGVALLGGVDVAPGKRGGDYQIAYGRGTSWRPKRLDAVTRTLAMWVDGRETDGSYAAGRAAKRARLNQNIRDLMAVFATETEQLVMTREVLLPSGVEEWSGLCEVASPVLFDADIDSDTERTLTVDLYFSDPLWYGAEQTDTIAGTDSLINGGEVAAVNSVITFSGGSDYVLENTTTGVTLVVASSGTIVVDCAAGTALAGLTNVIGTVGVTGSRDFMRIAPGTNNFELNSGSAQIVFRPPRL